MGKRSPCISRSARPSASGYSASVRETTETVTVELHAGSPPEAVGRMYIMIAVFGTLDVPLQSPLGDREVLSVHRDTTLDKRR